MMSFNAGEKVAEVITLSSDEEFSEPPNKQVHIKTEPYEKNHSVGTLSSNSSFNLPKIKSEFSVKHNVYNGSEASGKDLSNCPPLQGSARKRMYSDSVKMPLPKKKCISMTDNAANSKSSRELFDEFLIFIKSQMALCVKEEEKIINKVQSSFIAADSQYIESPAFCSLLNNTIKLIKEDKNNIFVYILEMVRELKVRKKKKIAVADSLNTEAPIAVGYFASDPGPSTSNMEEPVVSTAVPNGVDHTEEKKEMYIRKLERLLKRISKKIDKLQKRELSLDDLDDDDSYYIREDRLKKRFVKVWELLCKTKQCSSHVDRHIYKKFRYSGTKYPELNKRVEDLINKKRIFPDFSDIYQLVLSTSNETNLKFPPGQIEMLAKEVFSDVGKELKHRRQLDDEDIMQSYLIKENVTSDPADGDVELQSCLERSSKYGDEKMQQVIDEFVQKQYALKLEPVEVPDGAPSSSGDDNQEEEDNDVENNSDLGASSGSSETESVTAVPDSEKLVLSAIEEENDSVHDQETQEQPLEKLANKQSVKMDSENIVSKEISIIELS